MKPRRSIIGSVSSLPIIKTQRSRRFLVAVALITCALLAFFPERHRVALSLTPTDPASLGLSGTLGQLGAVGSVFGNQAAVEVSLKVARSQYVQGVVIRRTKLNQRLGLDRTSTSRWLERHVSIRSLRGGIIQIEMRHRDPDLALALISTYGEATREQLAIISRRQTALKRAILSELVESASERLARAQNAFDTFRLETRYSSPAAAIYAAGDRIPELEATIRNAEVELAAMRKFATERNLRVRLKLAEIAALEGQLAKARSTSPIQQSSVGQVVKQSTQVEKLRRELDLAQSLYDNYKRYFQGTSVEDLTSSANIRILEPAYVDTARQINIIPASLALVILVIGLAIEFYSARPPLVESRSQRETAA